MKPEYPSPHMPYETRDEVAGTESRFLDEKISDQSGAESSAADSALAPAGLSNPFWN